MFGAKITEPTTLQAGAAITRRRFVKRGADALSAVPATAASANLGVALEHQDTVGAAFAVAHRPGELVEVEAGAAVALDAYVTSDAAGKAITAAVGNPISGVARRAAAADTEIIIVELVGPKLVA